MRLVDGITLLSVSQLDERREDPGIRVFDCAVHLVPDPKTTFRMVSGQADWLRAHIPDAGFLDLTGDLSRRDTALRFMMPDPAQAAAAFAAAGVVDGVLPVLYSSTHPMWATRIWWMLHSLGVQAAVLDGGLGAWRRAGLPLQDGDTALPAGDLTVAPRGSAWADRDAVLAHIADGGTCVVNALSTPVYRGEGDHHYGRRGHITGSVSVPYDDLFDQGTLVYRDEPTLRRHFDAHSALQRPVVCYCGGGIAATTAAFALHRLGHTQVAVYDGSMSEWAADPALPLTTGSAPA